MFAELKSLSAKIAGELVFAEPGKDLGLLPINSLLGQMEELLGGNEVHEALARGAKLARGWVDAIFETTGTFSEAALHRFGEWSVRWDAVLLACENNAAPVLWPTEWEQPATGATELKPVVVVEALSTEEPSLTLNLEQDAELLGEFINESHEHLQNIEQGVLVLEENPADADTLDSIFRAFHTFKGGSGFLNLTAIQTLAHELESLLDLARQHKLAITPANINLILEGGDTLKKFTGEIAARLAGQQLSHPIQVPTLGLLARIRSVLNGDASAAAPIIAATTNRNMDGAPDSDPAIGCMRLKDARSESGAPMAVSRCVPITASETSVAEKVESEISPVVQENSSIPTAQIQPEKSATYKAGAAAAVKVDTLKLDSLVDLIGEMVIAQSLVVQNPELANVNNEQLTRDLAQLGRISKDLQRTAMSLRMVPIRATFQKMNRLVRDITAKVGKQVKLVTEGEDTELDRTIVEEISDPLIHMIRNSVDHGIEKPEVRVQRGKLAQGVISLRAFHQGGNIVIEIKDDGNGLDRKKILAKAIQRGLVKSEEQLEDSQIFNLIMGAGFSTAEEVTDLSGRGVGMDVVRRNIEKMRGKIEIRSTAGEGSTFSIYLPLTLAIIDGLIVGVGEHRYIVPTLSVCESFQPAEGMIKTVHGRGEMINARGRLRPLLRLHEQLGVRPAADQGQAIVVVVEAGHDTRCVMVDQLLGKQEVVIKSLGESFKNNRYVSGAAILGDGRVGLILDPQALVHLETTPTRAAA